MFFNFIYDFSIGLLSKIFTVLPSVEVLPFGIDEVFVYVFGLWNSFLVVFPPFAVVWQCLLWYYGFKFSLLGLRLVLLLVNLIRGAGAKI